MKLLSGVPPYQAGETVKVLAFGREAEVLVRTLDGPAVETDIRNLE